LANSVALEQVELVLLAPFISAISAAAAAAVAAAAAAVAPAAVSVSGGEKLIVRLSAGVPSGATM
jgi:hypothetical protein